VPKLPFYTDRIIIQKYVFGGSVYVSLCWSTWN